MLNHNEKYYAMQTHQPQEQRPEKLNQQSRQCYENAGVACLVPSHGRPWSEYMEEENETKNYINLINQDRKSVV